GHHHQLGPSHDPERGADEELGALVHEERPDGGRLSQTSLLIAPSSRQSVRRAGPPGPWGDPPKKLEKITVPGPPPRALRWSFLKNRWIPQWWGPPPLRTVQGPETRKRGS